PVLAVWVRTLATAGLSARPRRASPPPLQGSLVAPSSHGTRICTRHSTCPKAYELTEYLRIHSECGLRLGAQRGAARSSLFLTRLVLGPLLMLDHQSSCNRQANFEQSRNQFRHQFPPHWKL
ncbi:hypothetical protein EDB83DRAFT_2391182, partial [Lactarius deliciosus]